MKVKIGDKYFDPGEEPILFIFEDPEERIQIAQQILNARRDCTKYCQYPDHMNADDIELFMKID